MAVLPRTIRIDPKNRNNPATEAFDALSHTHFTDVVLELPEVGSCHAGVFAVRGDP